MKTGHNDCKKLRLIANGYFTFGGDCLNCLLAALFERRTMRRVRGITRERDKRPRCDCSHCIGHRCHNHLDRHVLRVTQTIWTSNSKVSNNENKELCITSGQTRARSVGRLRLPVSERPEVGLAIVCVDLFGFMPS